MKLKYICNELIPNKIDAGLEEAQCRQQDSSLETFFLNLLD